MDLKSKITEVPNWPKEGVNFKDITTLLEDPQAFRTCISLMRDFCAETGAEKIIGIDARGFIFASPVAHELNAGLIIARKPGKLPRETIEEEYKLEYGINKIQIHKDAIKPGEKVALVDDLIATGGTALAVCNLVEKLGGTVSGAVFLIDLPFLEGSNKIKSKNIKVKSLITYDN